MALEYSHDAVRAVVPPLVTLADAKVHLRVTDSAHDADVSDKLAVAQAWVLAYMGPAGDTTWTSTTAPTPVIHAIKIVLTLLYEHRGDDMDSGTSSAEATWGHIRTLLSGFRDPTLA
jgi:hypothetical protein